jgi:hypothetical protein
MSLSSCLGKLSHCGPQLSWSLGIYDIGFTDLVQHKINTGTALTIRQPIRRLPFGKREIEKEETNKMLAMGVIEPSSSLWSSFLAHISCLIGSCSYRDSHVPIFMFG